MSDEDGGAGAGSKQGGPANAPPAVSTAQHAAPSQQPLAASPTAPSDPLAAYAGGPPPPGLVDPWYEAVVAPKPADVAAGGAASGAA